MNNPHRYVVSYHVDFDSDGPVAAAQELARILGLEDDGGVFVVRDKTDGSMVEVTLSDEGGDPVVVPGGCQDCRGPAPSV